MSKKTSAIVVVLVLSMVLLYFAMQLGAGSKVLSDGDTLEKDESWSVSGNLILDWDTYKWHTVVFLDCDGFKIETDNTVLDLNGHTVMWKTIEMGGIGNVGVSVVGKRGVTVRNGTIVNFQYGIWVDSSSLVNIMYNNVSGSRNDGISVRGSDDVAVVSNEVSGSMNFNLGVDYSSNVTVFKNKVAKSAREGIWIKDCGYINVTENTVLDNRFHGIHVYNSDSNTICGNTITNNPQNGGIYMGKTEHTTINDNTISKNPNGIRLEESSNNTIFHNNFINNTDHIDLSINANSTNTWSVGYGREGDESFGGNYWDNYRGVDLASGVNQTVLGSDGIGDVPYSIDEGNKDQYPLMNPWCSLLRVFCVAWTEVRNSTVCEVAIHLAVYSNSTVKDFYFDETLRQIRFKVSNGTFSKVVFSRRLLDGALAVQIDNLNVPSISDWDESHHFISVDFKNETHEIKIRGEMVMRLPGDLNVDGEVNIVDISIVAKHFGDRIEN